jgi:hypothetical protein
MISILSMRRIAFRQSFSSMRVVPLDESTVIKKCTQILSTINTIPENASVVEAVKVLLTYTYEIFKIK